jgi:hypothetical protein
MEIDKKNFKIVLGLLVLSVIFSVILSSIFVDEKYSDNINSLTQNPWVYSTHYTPAADNSNRGLILAEWIREGYVSAVLLTMLLFSIIMLSFVFKKWVRALYLEILVLVYVQDMIMGDTVSFTPLQPIDDLVIFLSWFIVYATYFSPLKNEYV